mgnify:CR=1 FL=1
MTDPVPDPAQPAPASAWPPPPRWLQTVIVLTALGWGTAETFVLGARPQSYAFILAVLFGSVGVRAVATVRERLR